jgi:uncharacterized phage protein (TIGR02218 family)
MNAHNLEAQQYDSCEVYEFTTSAAVYRYTSYKENLTIGGNNYRAIPINRSSFKRDLMGQSISINVQLPVSSEFSEYIVALPVIPITFTIRKFFFDDLTQSELVFSGEVESLSVNGQVINAGCVSSTKELDRKLPRFICQSYCNNILGDSICGIDLESPAANIRSNINVDSIDNIDQSIIYSAVLVNWPEGSLVLGRVVYGAEERLITKSVPDGVNSYIKLHSPIIEISVGDTIAMYRPCDKSFNQCLGVFNNIQNFTGMPNVPRGTNPTIYGVA